MRHIIDAHTAPIPAVLEIPSKDFPYDVSKDSILKRAKVSCIINRCIVNVIITSIQNRKMSFI